MLAARITVVQVLDHFQVGVTITEFSAGQEPTTWTQSALTFGPDEMLLEGDALSTVIALIALWSEKTIS